MQGNEMVYGEDAVLAALGRGRPTSDSGLILGRGIAVIRDRWDRIQQSVEFENLITEYGDQVIMERYADIGVPDDEPQGMRLGSGGATAVAKTGAGAAIVTYISGSHAAHDSGPTSTKPANARVITFSSVWAAGTATNGAINEWVVTNENPLTDVAGAAGNTISRAVTGSALDKKATDSLTITWTHSFEGS